MIAAFLFLMLAAFVVLLWAAWTMMPLCPSENGFEWHDLREISRRAGGSDEGEAQGVASVAPCAGSLNE